MRVKAEEAEEFQKGSSKHVARNDTVICSDPPKNVKVVGTKPAPAFDDNIDYNAMPDEEILDRLLDGSLKDYQLEKKLGDYERAVGVRRSLYESLLDKDLSTIPYQNYDWAKVFGANCEIVIGYVPIPLGK